MCHVCFLFPVLISGVLFSAAAEFSRNIKEIDLLFSVVSEGEASGSGGTALLVPESFLLRGQTPIQRRARPDRPWKQFLSPAVFMLFPGAFDKITMGKHCLYGHFSRVFFHLLVISLLLGGRAPPRSVY